MFYNSTTLISLVTYNNHPWLVFHCLSMQSVIPPQVSHLALVPVATSFSSFSRSCWISSLTVSHLLPVLALLSPACSGAMTAPTQTGSRTCAKWFILFCWGAVGGCQKIYLHLILPQFHADFISRVPFWEQQPELSQCEDTPWLLLFPCSQMLSVMEETKIDLHDIFLINPSCLLIITSCEWVSFVRVSHVGVRCELSQWI